MIRSAEQCGRKRKKNRTQPDNFTKYEIIMINNNNRLKNINKFEFRKKANTHHVSWIIIYHAPK